jgi:signal transduction histidine kinase
MSLVILAEDVTERNRAKAELLQQQSTLEQINSALLQRVQLERLTAEISSHLIGLHTQEIDEGIETALASIGTFTGADRAYLFMFRDDGKVIDNTHEWCDQGIESQKEKLQGIALDDELPWFAKQIRTHQVLHIKNVHELPEEAEASKELLKIQRILSLLIVPMVSAGRLIGFLGFDAVRKQRIWTMDDRSVLCIVGESFAHLLERRRTEKALRDSENKLRCLSDQLIRAQEKERNRIAAELHDELGQSLMALKLKLRFRFNALEEEESVKDSLLEVLRDIDEIADKTRRISGELRPAILEDLGLFAALKKLAEDTMGHSDARIYVDIADIRGAVTYEQELLLFRIFQEALTNALKHARPSRVWFTIQAEDDMLYCSIADNGEGRLEWEGNPSPRAAGGLGLSIMEERARMLEAKLDVQSGAGKGTRISFTVPLTRGAQ